MLATRSPDSWTTASGRPIILILPVVALLASHAVTSTASTPRKVTLWSFDITEENVLFFCFAKSESDEKLSYGPAVLQIAFNVISATETSQLYAPKQLKLLDKGRNERKN